jgi:MFS family permease
MPKPVHSSSPPQKPSSPKLALAIVFLVVFVDLLGFGMVLPLLPVYAKQLTDSPAVLGLLMISFSLMQLLFSPLWGRLSDRIGRRPVLLIGLVGSTVFYFVFGVATVQRSLFWMFASRIGAGVAGATISTAQAYIADVTTRENRTRGMALIGAAFGLGFTVGPLLGALAMVMAGDTGGGPEAGGLSPWPGYAAAILSAFALLLAFVRLPESMTLGEAEPAHGKFDLQSLRRALAVPSIAVLLATSFVCVFALANFEATISFAVASFLDVERSSHKILLVFAFVGLVQALVQGGLVRRLARRFDESLLATVGVVLSIVGYVLLGLAGNPEYGRLDLFMLAAAVEVTGIGFLDPSLRSLLSRRSGPSDLGGIFGAGESVSALARITGVYTGVQLYHLAPSLPFFSAAGLMLLGLGLVRVAIRTGADWQPVAAGTDGG